MKDYKEITIRVRNSTLKSLVEDAVEIALDEFTDTEMAHAGVDYDSLCKELFESLDWNKELSEGLVDHLEDYSDRFAEEIVYRKPKILADAVKSCKFAEETLES